MQREENDGVGPLAQEKRNLRLPSDVCLVIYIFFLAHTQMMSLNM